MKNFEILNGLNDNKVFKDKKFDFIIFDTNSLTIVPNLNNDKYESNDNIIVSPFVETFKLYVRLKKQFKNSKFIFVFDGGISPKITDILPTYKSNRKTSRCRKFDKRSKNIYEYNVLLLTELLTSFGEIVISNVHRNESDFIIGYIVKKMRTDNFSSLLFTHDQDFFQLYDKKTNIVYKDTSKNRGTRYIYFNNFDGICNLINFEYLNGSKDFLYYKSLIGDKSDDIPKPFGIKSDVIVKNLFKNCYIDDISITYEFIVEYFSKKIKNKDAFEKFKNSLRRNLYIINILNDEIISSSEKIILETHYKNIVFGNDDLQINSIYNLFENYGLHYTKEDIDKVFKYLRLII